MAVPDSLDNAAVLAARALLAVTEILDDVAASCDERLLESLLLNALNHIPDLGPQLLGCPPTANGGPDWNQFDRYAATAGPGAGLFVLTATRKQASLLTHNVDWSRWTILVPARVHEVTKAVIGPLPDGDGSVEQFVKSLARISR